MSPKERGFLLLSSSKQTNKQKNAHTSKYISLFNVLKANYSNTSTISYYEQKVKKKTTEST